MRHLTSLVISALAFIGSAGAQSLDAERYYAQCVEFHAQGDLGTAANACTSALTVDENYAPALRLLARIQTAQGDTSDAAATLERARTAEDVPENNLIEGELALARDDAARAESLADTILSAARPDPATRARALRLGASAAQSLGDSSRATGRLRELLKLEPDDLNTRRALADALLAREPRAAVELLRAAPAQMSAPVMAELGRAQWIAGDLPAATASLERAVASPDAFGGNREAYSRALGALAYAYYGSGRLTEGAGVLAQLEGQRSLYALLATTLLPWVLFAAVLLALHLIGESRIEPLSTIEIQEGPRAWTVSNVYGLLLLAALLGLLVAILTGRLAYGNLLALFTPVQSGLVRDLFFGTFAIVLTAGSIISARNGGWNPRETLLGTTRRDAAVEGILAGAGLVALTLVFQLVARSLPEAFGRYYLDLTTGTSRATLVLPLLLLPLTEVFFRAYAVYPMEKRYGRQLALGMLSLMYALALGSPVVLLAGIALGLLVLTNHRRSVMPAVVAQWTYHAGLVAVLLLFPAVRNWF